MSVSSHGAGNGTWVPCKDCHLQALLSGNLHKQNALIHTATVDIILDEQEESDSASVLQRRCRGQKGLVQFI